MGVTSRPRGEVTTLINIVVGLYKMSSLVSASGIG